MPPAACLLCVQAFAADLEKLFNSLQAIDTELIVQASGFALKLGLHRSHSPASAVPPWQQLLAPPCLPTVFEPPHSLLAPPCWPTVLHLLTNSPPTSGPHSCLP